MDQTGAQSGTGIPITTIRNLQRALLKYREPDQARSLFELLITIAPFVALWTVAWWAMSIGYWLTLLLSMPAALFLVRLFLIQHDCGHGAFFRARQANNWLGRTLGILTFTPYDVWRRQHAMHHASSGNLDRRGIGDIDTLTVREYRRLPRFRRLVYRLYRNPLVMFGIGPAYQFILRNRAPSGISTGDRHFWFSAMGTNVSIIVAASVVIYLVGLKAFILVQLPIIVIAASIGVWLFYVQHQFEDTIWEHDGNWDLGDAALHGSSHYDLPRPLAWITAYIGVHHVHHLNSRIPYYRLPQVLRDFPELIELRRLTLGKSLSCLRLRLWDEQGRRLVSFAEARMLTAR
jgi:omega-6 fatty acid desaturase (delta-12 desaturase)